MFRPSKTVYYKDFQSLEKMLSQFKNCFDHKLLNVEDFYAYQKNIHEIQLMINTFLNNFFEILDKKVVASILASW